LKNIISGLSEIVQKSKNTMEVWENAIRYLRDEMMGLLGEYFEKLDQELVKEYVKKKGYRCENKSERTVDTWIGKVTFTRHLLYDKKDKPHYVLDEVLGLKPRMRMSPDIWKTVAEIATSPGQTYRMTSKIMKDVSGISMSHTTVGRLVKEAGKAQENWDEKQREEIFEKVKVPEAPPIDRIFCEVDGLYVKGIGKSIEIKSMVNYTGWEQVEKNRWSLANRHVYATVEPSEDFWEGSYTYIRNQYDLEGAEVVVNGDGAAWIGKNLDHTFAEASHVIRQLDPFHVKRSIQRGLRKQPELRNLLEEAITKGDQGRAEAVIDTSMGNAECSREEKRIQEMADYLLNHWPYLQDWRSQTKYSLENARGMGTIESNLRRMSYRMKRRGMRWSLKGAQAVVKVQQGKINGTLEQALLVYRPVCKIRKVWKEVAKCVHSPIDYPTSTRINVANAPSTSPIGQLERIGRVLLM
jgi:hypothetical protein